MSVGHNHVTILCQRKACRELKLALLVALASKVSKEGTIRLKDLNAMILEVCQDDESLGIDGNSCGSVQSPVTTPLGPEIQLEFALGIELDHSVISCVGYQVTIIFCYSHVTGTVELAVAVARGTE